MRRNLLRRARPLDALVLPVPSGAGRPSAAVVERGLFSPPWFVARQRAAQARAQGLLHGAHERRRPVRQDRALLSRHAPAVHDDHGARGRQRGTRLHPAAADGTVRAVGVTTLVFGLLQSMCFTPLQPVLDALDAKLVTSAG